MLGLVLPIGTQSSWCDAALTHVHSSALDNYAPLTHTHRRLGDTYAALTHKQRSSCDICGGFIHTAAVLVTLMLLSPVPTEVLLTLLLV